MTAATLAKPPADAVAQAPPRQAQLSAQGALPPAATDLHTKLSAPAPQAPQPVAQKPTAVPPKPKPAQAKKLPPKDDFAAAQGSSLTDTVESLDDF